MYYAVKKGFKTGIFEEWKDVSAAINGFSGAEHKKFKTKEEAEAYLEDRDVWKEQVEKDNKDGFLVAFTDGSYDKNLNRYSYGVVLIRPDGTETGICGYGSNKEYIESNNIIGEIFGVINAFDWALSNGFEKIKIYHDLEGLSKWLTGEWTARAKVTQMFVNLYKSKFEGFLKIEFEHVKGHANIIYNKQADELAKSALIDRKKVSVKGENWFSIPYFTQDDFNAFVNLVKESDEKITFTIDDKTDKSIYRFSLDPDHVAITLYKTGMHKLLVQGKNSYLFQIITTLIVELDDDSKVEQILGNAYRISIKKDIIEKPYDVIVAGLPKDYPSGIKRLIKQSIINLNYWIESVDYSQYVFPALRALEGHIKYLISLSGGIVKRVFDCFDIDDSTSRYYVKTKFPDNSRNIYIENCYNYYKSQRDTLFHFGDILGSVDNSRGISSMDEASEIIKECINLISTQY